jgi:hypothetical protein
MKLIDFACNFAEAKILLHHRRQSMEIIED